MCSDIDVLLRTLGDLKRSYADIFDVQVLLQRSEQRGLYSIHRLQRVTLITSPPEPEQPKSDHDPLQNPTIEEASKALERAYREQTNAYLLTMTDGAVEQIGPAKEPYVEVDVLWSRHAAGLSDWQRVFGS